MEQLNLTTESNVTETKSEGRLHRTLKTRHLSMIALGGAIGTGLFLASGSSISTAGAGGALVAFLAVGIMIYFMMTSLGEMATLIPSAGSFDTYATRFVDPALGFAIGWSYWATWALTLPTELTAASLVMKYWFPDSSSFLWCFLFLSLMLLLNVFSARGYGEGEYWFSIIKVATIILFLIAGLAMIVGILGGKAVGFENFNLGGTPFHGGFAAIFIVFLAAGFSFQGTELVGLASGEAENPEKTIPKSIKQTFWRILIFYVLAIFVIGILIPYNDPSLLNSSTDVAVSPFTLVFKRAGLAAAAAVMNTVILTAVLSAGNASIYASSRMLWALAKEGKAPRCFTKLSSKGVPLNAIFLVVIVGMLAFLSSFYGNGVVYSWLISATGLVGFYTWLGISISHYRFRKAYIAQGRDLNKLVYKAKWFPFGPIFSIVISIMIILGQSYSFATSGDSIPWGDFIAPYSSLPIFLVTWIGYKYMKKTKVVPLEECDFEFKD
ncbi:amino acid permease [Brevibacillus fluminis]|uniref:Amino acid permease n=1 Tax=Brevibacillus fluminis TaxID=511487 RepID=A0A3M8D950_9BACL|nr:amino acid permease [Brevibacillus fluminis]RNB84562.1 amino acid permease [Brevibacillus fluminis]